VNVAVTVVVDISLAVTRIHGFKRQIIGDVELLLLSVVLGFLCTSNFVRSHLAIDVCLSVKRMDCDKTKAPSEKSPIMTNRKSPKSFPMSLR